MRWIKATAQLTKGGTGFLVAGVACKGAVGPASVMHVCRLCRPVMSACRVLIVCRPWG